MWLMAEFIEAGLIHKSTIAEPVEAGLTQLYITSTLDLEPYHHVY